VATIIVLRPLGGQHFKPRERSIGRAPPARHRDEARDRGAGRGCADPL